MSVRIITNKHLNIHLKKKNPFTNVQSFVHKKKKNTILLRNVLKNGNNRSIRFFGVTAQLQFSAAALRFLESMATAIACGHISPQLPKSKGIGTKTRSQLQFKTLLLGPATLITNPHN